MESILIPSLIMALIAAAGFVLVAGQNGQIRTLWGLAGGLIGMVLTAICLGVGFAVSIPLSHTQRMHDFSLSIAIAFALLGLIASGIIVALHRRAQKRIAS